MQKVLGIKLASQHILPVIPCKVSLENGPDASSTYMGRICPPNVDRNLWQMRRWPLNQWAGEPGAGPSVALLAALPSTLPASLQEATAVVIYLYSEDLLSGIALLISVLAIVLVL